MPQMGNPAGDIEGENGKRHGVPPDSSRLTCGKALQKIQFQPACHRLRPAVHVEFAIDVL